MSPEKRAAMRSLDGAVSDIGLVEGELARINAQIPQREEVKGWCAALRGLCSRLRDIATDMKEPERPEDLN